MEAKKANMIARNAIALARRDGVELADEHLLVEAKEVDMLPWSEPLGSDAAKAVLPRLWAAVRRIEGAGRGGRMAALMKDDIRNGAPRVTKRAARVMKRWDAHVRGLRRAHHGAQYGTDAEHALFLSASASDDPSRAALGRGYRAGLTMTAAEPDAE